MGGFEPTIATTIEQVLTPAQEARQLRKKTNAAIRDIRRTGKASQREIRRTALAGQLPPTVLGRTAYHAGSIRDLVEIVAAIGVATVAIRRTWQELQIRRSTDQAHTTGTESAPQDDVS